MSRLAKWTVIVFPTNVQVVSHTRIQSSSSTTNKAFFIATKAIAMILIHWRNLFVSRFSLVNHKDRWNIPKVCQSSKRTCLLSTIRISKTFSAKVSSEFEELRKLKRFCSTGEHFVNFYAPWCKYCQIFEPTWTSLAYSTDLSSVVKISKVDCTANEYTCSYFGIKEYPSILWISDGKIVDSYRGPIELDALKEFINRQINSYMIRKSAHNIQEGDEENDYLKVLIDSPLHHYQPSVLNEITKKLQRIADQLNEAKSVDSFLTSKGLSLVLYCVPWSRHCREMSNEWHQLDNLLSSQSKLNSYYIDCSTGQSEEFCDQQKVTFVKVKIKV